MGRLCSSQAVLEPPLVWTRRVSRGGWVRCVCGCVGILLRRRLRRFLLQRFRPHHFRLRRFRLRGRPGFVFGEPGIAFDGELRGRALQPLREPPARRPEERHDRGHENAPDHGRGKVVIPSPTKSPRIAVRMGTPIAMAVPNVNSRMNTAAVSPTTSETWVDGLETFCPR
jgi:hypothetical protein